MVECKKGEGMYEDIFCKANKVVGVLWANEVFFFFWCKVSARYGELDNVSFEEGQDERRMEGFYLCFGRNMYDKENTLNKNKEFEGFRRWLLAFRS